MAKEDVKNLMAVGEMSKGVRRRIDEWTDHEKDEFSKLLVVFVIKYFGGYDDNTKIGVEWTLNDLVQGNLYGNKEES